MFGGLGVWSRFAVCLPGFKFQALEVLLHVLRDLRRYSTQAPIVTCQQKMPRLEARRRGLGPWVRVFVFGKGSSRFYVRHGPHAESGILTPTMGGGSRVNGRGARTGTYLWGAGATTSGME